MSANKIIAELNAEQMSKDIPDFSPGDTVVCQVKVKEGNRERLQAFEGVVIGKRNRGLNSAFTVRKISFGEGVERVFPLFGPRIDSIEVVRRGKVRRAKLYYLRGRTGKRARISERTTGRGMTRKGNVVVPETGKVDRPEDNVALPAETAAEENTEAEAKSE